MRNMASAAVGNLGIAVFTANSPTDEEWREMIALVKKADLAKFRGISFSDGGAPNSAQRKLMNDCTQEFPVPSVVVTSNTLVRGVVTAMSWFNKNMRSFSPDQIDDALRHLNVNDSEFGMIKLEVQRLVVKLGSPPLSCIPKNL